MRVTLLGAGSWGTAMAAQASRYLHEDEVCLWSRTPVQLEEINRFGENRKYLPGIRLPKSLLLESNFSKAIDRLDSSDLLLIATPMSGLSETVQNILKIASHPLNIVWLCKGLEPKTALLPHQVVEREFLNYGRGVQHSCGVLSGPSFAHEVGEGAPCALAEMMRLVKAAGGKAETCMGLTGVGDLILTATGDLSRNRQVGLSLAAGTSLAEILKSLGHVAEGVLCAPAVANLAARLGVDMPITATMCEVLSGKLSPEQAVQKLMGRNPTIEH